MVVQAWGAARVPICGRRWGPAAPGGVPRGREVVGPYLNQSLSPSVAEYQATGPTQWPGRGRPRRSCRHGDRAPRRGRPGERCGFAPVSRARKWRPQRQRHPSRPWQAGGRRVWVQTPRLPLRRPTLSCGAGAPGRAVPPAAKAPRATSPHRVWGSLVLPGEAFLCCPKSLAGGPRKSQGLSFNSSFL